MWARLGPQVTGQTPCLQQYPPSSLVTYLGSFVNCLRLHCVSRCQKTVLGASILLRVQKKSMNEQVKSHDRDVISGDGGDNCCRGHFALTTYQTQPRVFHVYEFILLHNYPMRYPHFTKKKMGTQVAGWQGLGRQALIARYCDTGYWRPVCISEEHAAELKSKGCEGGNTG